MGPRAARPRGGRAAVRGAAFGALLVGAWCDAPGEGPKAERGYRRAAPVIAALARFRADHGQYPDSLPQLVPAYLPAAALAVADAPQERYPLGYRRATDQYELSFRYAGLPLRRPGDERVHLPLGRRGLEVPRLLLRARWARSLPAAGPNVRPHVRYRAWAEKADGCGRLWTLTRYPSAQGADAGENDGAPVRRPPVADREG
jgi:hypothetical protein